MSMSPNSDASPPRVSELRVAGRIVGDTPINAPLKPKPPPSPLARSSRSQSKADQTPPPAAGISFGLREIFTVAAVAVLAHVFVFLVCDADLRRNPPPPPPPPP
eukprot:Hpha_TRINITY_DN8921_c0_g1::TRINITY_DN8921_c0_g1_i2::g.80859::m.80859